MYGDAQDRPTDRSTSASVADQFETQMRIRRLPRHLVPPIQQVPSRWTASNTRSVRASSPKETSTWFSTTSLAISTPPSVKPRANRRVRPQHRSTRSATPPHPSCLSAAQVAKPRARREDSGVTSEGAARRHPNLRGRPRCRTGQRRAPQAERSSGIRLALSFPARAASLIRDHPSVRPSRLTPQSAASTRGACGAHADTKRHDTRPRMNKPPAVVDGDRAGETDQRHGRALLIDPARSGGVSARLHSRGARPVTRPGLTPFRYPSAPCTPPMGETLDDRSQ